MQGLLTLYVVERWLARLSVSPHADQFVLKGGMLLAAFGARRPTADVDTLARDFANDEASVMARVVAIANQPVPEDGVDFRTQTVTSRLIREEDLYSGVRVAMDCVIATAIVKLRMDINFGDPITPAPQLIDLPALRSGEPPIRILGYPLASVLAEKIATAIVLGPANTRVRDYADVYTLTGRHPIPHSEARQALVATSTYRGVEVVPLSTTIGDVVKLRGHTYAAYRVGLGPDSETLPTDFARVVSGVLAFADRLVADAPPSTKWDIALRRWID